MNHEENHDVANIEKKIAPTRIKPGHNLLIFETYDLIYGYYGCYCRLDVMVGCGGDSGGIA